MTNTNFKLNVIAALAVIITSFTMVSCGGGSAAPLPGPGNGNGVAPGTTDVNGLIIQGSAEKASSTVGDGLPGLLVSLISTSTGQLMGSDVTDGLGKYEFKGIPSGDGYLVKVEFSSSQDLDGNGQPDEIELYFPVDLADQAVMELLQQIGVSDSDNDGQLDAIEVEFHSTDDKGHVEDNHTQHQRRNGKTSVDSNNDGSFDDSDDSFDDSDADGLPDSSSSDDSNSGLHEMEVKGQISAIDGNSITVGDASFTLTSSTTWRIGDNRSADPAEFTVGTYVEVEGRSDGNGGWIASKVKTEDDGAGDDNGGGSNDDGVGDDSGDDSSDDGVGDDSGDDSSDDGVGDDSSDDSSDDGVGDDSGDDSSDDGVGDDSGDDSSDDGVGDDSGDDSSDDSTDDGEDDGTDDGGGDNSGKGGDDN